MNESQIIRAIKKAGGNKEISGRTDLDAMIREAGERISLLRQDTRLNFPTPKNKKRTGRRTENGGPNQRCSWFPGDDDKNTGNFGGTSDARAFSTFPVDNCFYVETVGLAERIQKHVDVLELDSPHQRSLSGIRTGLYDTVSWSISQASNSSPLAELARQNRLSALEVEILLLLAASALGEFEGISEIEDVQRVFDGRHRRMAIIHALARDGRLATSGLAIVCDNSRKPKNWDVYAGDSFVYPLMLGRDAGAADWRFESQEELLLRLPLLQRAFLANIEKIEDADCFYQSETRASRERDRLMQLFVNGVSSEWPMAAVFRDDKFNLREKTIMAALLCEAVLGSPSRGFWDDDNRLDSGERLWKAVADNAQEGRTILRQFLSKDALLLAEEIITPVTFGPGFEMRDVDEDAIRSQSFELTATTLKRIGVKRRRHDGMEGRMPRVTFDQLILSPAVSEALETAVAQVANAKLMDEWGLNGSIAYGRGVTLLFYGPPGIGKTACAEAMAARLEKRLLTVDYSRIQCAWVGETEKNIVKSFRSAREGDCVLFWDEADAMFYDRDSASQNWEVRDVNVLLQELERFEGVCILSTNRRVTLDKALARRISMKVEFTPPTNAASRCIWDKLVPASMPLADDVDFDQLSRVAFTGGEIKNIVLNAARRAMRRGGTTRVSMEDFHLAVESEKRNRDFSMENRQKVGFNRPY